MEPWNLFSELHGKLRPILNKNLYSTYLLTFLDQIEIVRGTFYLGK